MPKTDYEYIKEFRDRLGEQEVDFKFSEDKILMDIADYVMDTYDSHYAQTKVIKQQKSLLTKVMVLVSVWAIL